MSCLECEVLCDDLDVHEFVYQQRGIFAAERRGCCRFRDGLATVPHAFIRRSYRAQDEDEAESEKESQAHNSWFF